MLINNQKQKPNWLIYISSTARALHGKRKPLPHKLVWPRTGVFLIARVLYFMNFAGCLLNLFLQAKLQK
jgi:hypothetical protein